MRHRRRKDRLRYWLAGSSIDVARHRASPGPNQHELLERKERSARVYLRVRGKDERTGQPVTTALTKQ